jgi:hypothetical protein
MGTNLPLEGVASGVARKEVKPKNTYCGVVQICKNIDVFAIIKHLDKLRISFA